MIIRRRHTKNFTTIGNALFKDDRLALDEVGIVAYLLSQPDDWEVRRPALMRRWHIGRDSLRRIIHNLMRTGWCQARRIRLSNGTFHTEYEILDEPGPSLSDEEVKEALSLVSSEASDLPETTSPDTGQPDTGEPGTANPTWPIESLQNPDLQNLESTNVVGGGWDDLRKRWPPHDILSSVVCEKLFWTLSRAERLQAVEAAQKYLDICRDKNRKICDLSTYLKERRFDRSEVVPNNVLWQTKPGTAGAKRWLESGQLTAFQTEQLRRGHAITTPTEFPKSTGPPSPSSLMTPEDEDELAKKWG